MYTLKQTFNGVATHVFIYKGHYRAVAHGDLVVIDKRRAGLAKKVDGAFPDLPQMYRRLIAAACIGPVQHIPETIPLLSEAAALSLYRVLPNELVFRSWRDHPSVEVRLDLASFTYYKDSAMYFAKDPSDLVRARLVSGIRENGPIAWEELWPVLKDDPSPFVRMSLVGRAHMSAGIQLARQYRDETAPEVRFALWSKLGERHEYKLALERRPEYAHNPFFESVLGPVEDREYLDEFYQSLVPTFTRIP